MGLFDLFTGSGENRALEAGRGVRGQFFDDNASRLNSATGAAQSNFRTGTGNAISELTGARDNAIGTFRAGEGDALDFINRGERGAQGAFGQARGAFGQAGSAFDRLAGLSDQFGSGTETLLDALGLRGAEGNTRATDAFGNSLGNTFELDQGLEAINRARAARGAGTISGGNIDRDTQIHGQKFANSKTDAFIDRLFGLTDRQLGAEGAVAGGRSQAQTNIGNSFQGEGNTLFNAGQNRAQIASDTAARIAALTSGTGSQVAGLQQGLGTQLGNAELNAANQEIALRQRYGDQIADSLLGGARARSQGSANALGAGLKVADLLAGLGGRVAGAGGGIGG